MKKILFVDDEENVLAGLKNLLRRFRKEWDMHFAISGQQALDKLAEAPFDIVISDMRMPNMDGAQLLRIVKERHPEVIRIVLSGHTETKAALRAVPVAHQYLSKPCEPKELRRTIDRACKLQSMLANESVRKVVGGLESLPSLPNVYAQLTAALSNPDTTVSDMAKIIEQDLALCTKLLKLVNSAFFRLAQKISNIERAVSYLGTNMIRYLTMSVEVFEINSASAYANLLQPMQAHAMAVSQLAHYMSTSRDMAEDAFMAGMLHDVGKLLLVTSLPDQFAQVLELAHQEGLTLYQAEEEEIGATHAEIGAFLLGLWGLPNEIVAAVAAHHDPLLFGEQEFGLTAVVHIANRLSHEFEESSADTCDQSQMVLDPAYLASLGVTDRLDDWKNQAHTLFVKK